MDDPIRLTRRDPDHNMARFYRLRILPDLFGGVVLIREWGRIGTRGQQMRHWLPDAAEAEALLQVLDRRKRARGYISARPHSG